MRIGAVSETDPGRLSVYLGVVGGGRWPHRLSLSRIRGQMLHFVHPESFYPPWRFPAVVLLDSR